MKTTNRQPILIVEPNGQLREEIVNFLLSAGYENIEETGSLTTDLDKIFRSAYEVVVADVGKPLKAGLQFAADLAQLSPKTKLILMIEAEDQNSWDQIAARSVEVRFMIKTDFARNLPYLLEECLQP
ncbi:MAG: response regulator [Blastocatellia bacterium]|nr:response regulator [Blastocatellia bacterium]